MSSILERPNLNKIFLIYGNLDDMFISPNLQKSNFRPFLNSYLRSIGYEQIVFYSGAKNVGKYVLDDISAVLAINKNKSNDFSKSSNTSSAEPQAKKPRRILSPKMKETPLYESDTKTNTNDIAARDSNKSPTGAVTEGLIYKQPKITPAEFLDDAKKMMADSRIKTAIVFTFFQDFVSDGSAPLQQYSELLSYMWDEYSLNSNENICIFLAPQMDSESISKLFGNLTNGEVFRNRFFNDNNTINRNCTINVGLPNQDEFRYMLDYLRIVGDKGKRISVAQKDYAKIVSSLMYLSREADREDNRAGYLSSVYENIVWYMHQQKAEVVNFTEDVVKQIYCKFQMNDSSNPMDTLRNTKGWEAVAERVSEIVDDYNQKKARALSKRPEKKKNRKTVYSNERIDTSDNDMDFDYPVPQFILKGNPGVGKTTVARLIGQVFYEAGILKKGQTIEATSDDLIDKYVGGTTEKTRECVMNAQESVLFIDDAYSLLDNSKENNYSKQAIDELVALMTNTKQYRFCLIMAGYPDSMDELLKMNPGLSSRFSSSNTLTIEDYPPELLKEIFISNCKKDGYRFWGDEEGEENPLNLDLFFKNLYEQRDRSKFGNARDIVSIARDVKMKASRRDDEARCIVEDDFAGYKRCFEQHGVTSIEDIYKELDQYVGLEFVKEFFENVRLEILDEQDCRRRGVKPDTYPDHYIFAGNPGTGKTTVGKMIGKFYNIMGVMGGRETIFVDASEFIGTHVGDSKEKVLEKIQEAIDRNALLYVDEAYQLIDTSYSSEIIGAMMTKMTENASDFKMIFGMYSNRVDDFLKLNDGLSGRLNVIEFPDYNPEQLAKIFDNTLEGQGRTITEEAHHLIELILEHKYNTRTESFCNAREVKNLAVDMKKLLLKRVSKAPEGVDRYQYVAEDIPADQLELIKDQINPRTFDDIMKDLNEQIGLSNLKRIVMQKQDEILYARKTGASTYDIIPGYYFFVGNPGTGKSTSAKLFGECLRELGIVKTNNFYSCTAKDLIGQYVGETDKKTYNLLKKSMNGVLFIDEAYSLAYDDSQSSSANYKKEALEQIIAFMDEPEHRKKCCIIFAGYQKDMQGLYRSNSGMRSRVEEVYFKDYSAEELYQIFELLCKKSGYNTSNQIEEYYLPIFEEMSRQKYYANGRTARTVFEKTVANLKHRVAHSDEINEESKSTIVLEDLLARDECLHIVADSDSSIYMTN